MTQLHQKQWLTVDDAFTFCVQKGLNRTKKTIRQWCRQEHVDCQKQQTPIGEQWMIDSETLEAKVNLELEFIREKPTTLENAEQVRTSSHQSEPVRTSSNPYEPVRTSADPSPASANHDNQAEQEKLKDQIRSLEIDKGIRDAQIKYLEKENSEGREALSAQARYIGHLETIASLSGASPEAKYLSSPKPNHESGHSVPDVDFVHPQQKDLRYNMNNGISE